MDEGPRTPVPPALVDGGRGVKLKRRPGDDPGRVLQWLSEGGQTTMRQVAAKWGAEREQAEELLRSLFEMLAERGLLKQVQLLGARGRAMPNASGVYRCRSCRARTVRTADLLGGAGGTLLDAMPPA